MKQRKAERFVTDSERVVALKQQALEAARQFRRFERNTGAGRIVVRAYQSRRVLGAVIHWTAQPEWTDNPDNGGPITAEMLRAAGLSPPSVLTATQKSAARP